MSRSNRAKIRKKGEIKMAVLTANCDKSFIVSPDKAKEFNALKANPELFKKIDLATSKLSKNLKVDINKK